MILICTAHVVAGCIRTTVAHGRSAITKDRVCPVCSEAMNRNPSLREQYNASILKGTDDGTTSEYRKRRA